MNRVVLFDLGSQDPEAATQWPVSTGAGDTPGIDGGSTRAPKDVGQRVQVTIQVNSIDEVIARVTENGATVDLDKMDFGGLYLAYLFDPQGIRFGLIQYK